MDPLPLNNLTKEIIGAAIAVHRELGPGLLESAYERCLAFELTATRLSVEAQVPLPVVYAGVTIDCSYRIDLLVDRRVIVEVKSVEKLVPVHEAQILSYMRLMPCVAGLLFNFNVKWLSEQGTRRFLNGFPVNP